MESRTRKVKGRDVEEWLCTLCTPEHWMKEDELYWRKGEDGKQRPYRCKVYEKADSIRRHQKNKKEPAKKRSTAKRATAKKSTAKR